MYCICICYTPSFFLLYKSNTIHNILTVDNKIPISCKLFCLTLERICSPQPAASGNRSVLGSNKTAVVLEPSQ